MASRQQQLYQLEAGFLRLGVKEPPQAEGPLLVHHRKIEFAAPAALGPFAFPAEFAG